ncbi:MAG TPA: alkaline phosphatase family protein, partial [Thermoanaerobaculia bacterium]|nr:alkaline phosphatase family protein [Thermoanaerobaculia bacterium]
MDERRRALPFVLAGALAGAAAADLLIGLNPDLLAPLAALRALTVLSAFGAVLGAPLAWLSRRPATRGATLILAVLLGLGAAFVETQRRLALDFVPAGTRRVLVAAALVLAVGAALLGAAASARRAPAGPLAAVLALLLLAPLAGRRAAGRPALASPVALPRAARRSLLVIGIEGASWDLLTAYASEGALPTIERLLRQGAAGPLASLAPYDRAALWTSAATGKKPAKHGVVSAFRREALSGTYRYLPVVPGLGRLVPPFGRWVREDGQRRRSLTFWEILDARGHECAVLDWPASAPAKTGPLLWATDRFFEGDAEGSAASPPEASRRARLFRVPAESLDRPLVRALVPEGLPDGPERREPLVAAARDLSVVGASLGALPAGPNNVAVLVLSGLATAARLFGGAGDTRYWGLAAPQGAEARARALKAYY